MKTHAVYEQLTPTGHVRNRIAGLSIEQKSTSGDASTWAVSPLHGVIPSAGDRFQATDGQWYKVTSVQNDEEPWLIEAVKLAK